MNFLFLTLAGILIFKKKVKPMNIKQTYSTYIDLAVQYGGMYNVQPTLVIAIIQQESAGQPHVIGTSGEIGLMQLTRYALLDFNNGGGSIRNYKLFNPKYNIQVGTWYIGFLIRYFDGDIKKALQAYNAGIGNVRKNENVSLEYAESVLKFQQTLNN